MASVIAMSLVGAVLNATAFIGGNYLAKAFSGGNADKERVRHDKAVEKFNRDHNSWSEKRQGIYDYINTQNEKKRNSETDFNITDESLETYKNTRLDDLGQEPVFSTYYQKPDYMTEYEYLYIIGGLGIGGFIIYRYL